MDLARRFVAATLLLFALTHTQAWVWHNDTHQSHFSDANSASGKTESVLSPPTATITGPGNLRAIYIHTDSLGTPALHTNTTGSEK